MHKPQGADPTIIPFPHAARGEPTDPVLAEHLAAAIRTTGTTALRMPESVPGSGVAAGDIIVITERRAFHLEVSALDSCQIRALLAHLRGVVARMECPDGPRVVAG